MRYLIVFFVFLLNGCLDLGCEYEYVSSRDKRNKYVSDNNNVELVESINENGKHFTIVNHTNKTYENNTLLSLNPKFYKEQNTWKLQYCYVQKINTINPKEIINKNEKGKALELNQGSWPDHSYSNRLFLFSLDGGKTKVFFGAYEDAYEVVWKDDNKECKRYFVKFDIHPVWQEKDLTIHIYNDKITFSDPKIKEVKRLRLSYDEYADPNTLELVDCSKE